MTFDVNSHTRTRVRTVHHYFPFMILYTEKHHQTRSVPPLYCNQPNNNNNSTKVEKKNKHIPPPRPPPPTGPKSHTVVPHIGTRPIPRLQPARAAREPTASSPHLLLLFLLSLSRPWPARARPPAHRCRRGRAPVQPISPHHRPGRRVYQHARQATRRRKVRVRLLLPLPVPWPPSPPTDEDENTASLAWRTRRDVE